MGHADHTAPPPSAVPPDVRAKLLSVPADAADILAHQLTTSWVPEYLNGRRLSAATEPQAPWRLGYARPSWTSLTDQLRTLGYSDETIEASGLALRARTGRLVDRFRDRLMLGIRDGRGDVVAFVGRARPGADARTPKYLNSPSTAIYHKGDHLFGLTETRSAIRAGGTPVLVEGPLDAVAVHTATNGRHAGVALCGTALTAQQAASLAAQRTGPASPVIVALDADPAGRSAAEAAHQRLTEAGLFPWAADLPPGIDPAEVLRVHGAARLTAALTTQTRPFVDVLVDRRIGEWSDRLRWAEGRVGAVRDVAPLIAGVAPHHRERLSQAVADLTGVDVATVRREVHSRRPERRADHRASTAPRPFRNVHRHAARR